jgi:hypothetical protein
MERRRSTQQVLGVFLKENVSEKAVAPHHRVYCMGYADTAAPGAG